MEKLREREADVVQRVTAKMKEVESYSYEARQRVLRDM
jgi:outer membrane lipoprotein-sorting protein